jgi:DHA1 family tetracycline resistance protein-like MFS transporter
VIGFSIYGLAPNGIIYCLGIPVMAFWRQAGPAAQGLMTRRVRDSEQGRLQGAIASLAGIFGLIGPGLLRKPSRSSSVRVPCRCRLYPQSSALSTRHPVRFHTFPARPFSWPHSLLLIAMAIVWRAIEGRP